MSCRAIGSLRHRVRLEEPLRIELSGGAANITWVRAAVLYAAVEAISGKEIVIADGIAGRVTHRITIRYRADIAPHMRFTSFGGRPSASHTMSGASGRVYDIRNVLDRDGRRRWLECLCEERLP